MEATLKIKNKIVVEDHICSSCGLCCDGSLIGFVKLNSEEKPKLKKLMDIVDAHENGFFLQPCKIYCGGCNIYKDRPKNCDDFNCKLLISIENKEIEFDYALEKIQDFREKKYAIEKQIARCQIELKSPSFYFKIVELKKVLNKIKLTSPFTPSQSELLLDLKQLEILVLKEFGISLD